MINPQRIEDGVAAAAQSWLDDAALTATVKKGLDYGLVGNTEVVVVCEMKGAAEHVVGPLYKANVRVVVFHPTNTESDDDASAALGNLSVISTTIGNRIDGFDAASQLEFNTASGYDYAGHFMESARPEVEGEDWSNGWELTLGVNTS